MTEPFSSGNLRIVLAQKQRKKVEKKFPHDMHLTIISMSWRSFKVNMLDIC